MSVRLTRDHARHRGRQAMLDLRSEDERLAAAVMRLERLTAWFDEALPPAPVKVGRR